MPGCRSAPLRHAAPSLVRHHPPSVPPPTTRSPPSLLQAPTCTVRVSVQPETTTEGHRVKLAAVILNLQSGTSFDYSAAAGFGAALG